MRSANTIFTIQPVLSGLPIEENPLDTVGHDTNRTRIHFYPVTGRTHQLRVHAAHASGLDIRIVGDDIYGQRNDQKRLCLHASYLELDHPNKHNNNKSGGDNRMIFEAKTPF